MKIYFYFLFILFTHFSYFSCHKVTDAGNNIHNQDYVYKDTVFFYPADSAGNPKSDFRNDEDIVFHFGVINNRDTALNYTKSHGGPPVVRFEVYKNDRFFGASDEGYVYPAVIINGAVQPHDTLRYSISWYSNPYHENELDTGEYHTVIDPYIRFDDFNLLDHLDTLYFEVTE